LVVATGNGTAGRFAPHILKSIGCNFVELDCEANWNFPNHNPNPEDVSFLHSIKEHTLKNHADLGIGLDGDGDRIGVIDNKGREVFSDKMGLILARWICSKHPSSSIVIDVKSTGLFNDDIVLKEANTNIVTWKTGHSYIKEKVSEVNAIAGFEKSGHWFFNTPYGRGYDDALLSSIILLRFLDECDSSLSDIIDSLPKTWQTPTLGVYCVDEEKYNVVKDVSQKYLADYTNKVQVAGKYIKSVLTVNGIRFTLENDSWGLVRASSNKPSLVLVAESRESEDELYDIMKHIQQRVADTGKIGVYDQQMPTR
jgi:phosphomannomutase/phosphoglucomutase